MHQMEMSFWRRPRKLLLMCPLLGVGIDLEFNQRPDGSSSYHLRSSLAFTNFNLSIDANTIACHSTHHAAKLALVLAGQHGPL